MKPVIAAPDWKLIVGDSAKILLDYPGAFDLLVPDPPYNLDQDYKAYDDRKSREAYLTWSENWITSAYVALKPTGSIWIAIGDHFVSEIDVFCKSLGLSKKAHVIWYYTFGQNHGKNFQRSHTHWLYYTKHKTQFTFNFNDPALRIPSARQTLYKDKRANPNGRLPDTVWILRPDDLPDGFKAIEDTWSFSRICGTFKVKSKISPNQMPIPMLERIIRTSSNPGDFVGDPFSGTGTGVIAANNTGRRVLGMDISQECIDESRKRIVAAVKAQDAVANHPQLPLFPSGTKPRKKKRK